MSSVSSVSSSSSIYGTRNVITGLASGMDTESMIENAISAYKTKISSLQQKRTKTEWKQEAYRSMITKMSSFTSKYASYQSSNNLMSASFFNNAVKTVAQGSNASKVTATGRASSDIQISRVKQLASAATYTLSGTSLDPGTYNFGNASVSATASGTMDLGAETTLNGFSGTMTLAYGGSNALTYLSIDFDESKTYDSMQELADEINRQLKDQSVTIGNNTYTGDNLLEKVIRAEVSSDGKSISFADPKGNNVYISAASDSVTEKLLGGAELSSTREKQVKSLRSSDAALQGMQEKMTTFQYLTKEGASMELTVDGKTKTIQMPDYAQFSKKLDALAAGSDVSEDVKNALSDYKKLLAGDDSIRINAETTKKLDQLRDQAYMEAIQDNVKSAFGDKVTVNNAAGEGQGIKLQFETSQNGSTISVKTSKGEMMGFGSEGEITSYLNTGKTLGELMGSDIDWSKFAPAYVKDSSGKATTTLAKDSDGNQLYSFMVNGKEVGQFNANSTLSDVFNAMNSNSDSEVKVGYSKLTNNVTFTSKDTGADANIKFEGLAAKLFGVEDASQAKTGSYSAGQDAVFEASVNGTTMELTRSSNSVELDGMTVNLKGTFGYEYSQNYQVNIGGKEYSATGSDDKLKFTTSSGSLVKYSAGASTDMAAFDGKEVYAKSVDGEMKFYVDDGEGNTKELYARQSNGGIWFSINQGTDDTPKTSIKKGEATATKVSTEAVSFETSSDADKIVDVIKQMVDDYNAMVTEIKSAYSTLPAQTSSGAYYEPMTSEEEAEYSETYVNSWNEKAKEGLLFGDRDLASLYERLTNAVSMTGEFGSTLRAAGITVNYSNGLSTLNFNEDDFRAALEKDPDAVRDAFVSSTESGAKQNGLMQALKTPLDMYGKTSGGKGILVEKAGHPLAASTMYTNSIQKELDNIDEQISSWQDKMSDKVDYYTNQFSRLEQLIQQMNSQSSYFSQLMGG